MSRRNVIQTAGAALAGAPAVALSAEETTVADSRRRRGVEALNRITQGQGRAVIESLADIAPALGDFIVEFSYGDVISRPQLDLKCRELATVAALAALGNAQPQLKVHIHGALNVGASREEIVEILIQTAVYAGFPAAINAVSTARQAFAERH
jgi:4-carboxymuconolactone decarboxylase